ncbi:hypothetical protein [Bittarella massiliensis (ex Durand et al. 2017)]|uniref:Uncharacterized protein n=1 Tax=Bittarella massiliensis (ex Durand et al. 2017) TaxID=1720313 RepID=A0AAW5KFV2_9FIRM|nr:hypothetical protein [Bittarella massiliensis (ex Durand et al. 2017)]MCQ4949584.1 hypothetical protein [Bittarella massiliensis (ex Durand et al. 2017)]
MAVVVGTRRYLLSLRAQRGRRWEEIRMAGRIPPGDGGLTRSNEKKKPLWITVKIAKKWGGPLTSPSLFFIYFCAYRRKALSHFAV